MENPERTFGPTQYFGEPCILVAYEELRACVSHAGHLRLLPFSQGPGMGLDHMLF